MSNASAAGLAAGGGPRRIVLLGLGAMIALAWAYVLYLGWGMENMDVGMDMALMPRMTDWQLVDLLLVFLMWVVMMVAMMLPSSLPMMMAFSRDTRSPAPHRMRRLTAFVAGYLAVWTAFSLLMTLLQWGLLETRLISPMMESSSALFGGLLLVAAGLFQFTALKHACLATCRSPLSFLLTEWRPGVRGAWTMGLRHGLYCTGCCWLLMGLLFLLGVMNVLWIVALTAFVLVEKTWPGTHWISKASGAALLAWGAALLAGAAAAG
jgi:predicted metal-binding membrane protein